MRVFVIWDLSSPAVHTLLEALPELCPTHAGQPLTWHIPSATVTGRQLARDVIARGIRESDHVIALLDRPSASVGWQVGLAIGWQRSLQLAFLGSALPTWTQVGVLKGLFAHHLSDVTGIRQLLELQPWEMPPIPSAPGPAGHLILCPSGPVGSTLRAVAQQDPNAQTLPDDGWGLYELPALLSGCGRVVWILASDVREGADNAASGVVAGFAEASGLTVAVLRAQDVPPVVDVQPRELRFHGLAEFKQKLQLAATGSPAPQDRMAGLPRAAANPVPESTAGLADRAQARSRYRWVLLGAALTGLLGLLGLAGGSLRWLLRPPTPKSSPPNAAVAPAAPAPKAELAAAPATAPPPAARPGPAAHGSPEHRQPGGSGKLAQRPQNPMKQMPREQPIPIYYYPAVVETPIPVESEPVAPIVYPRPSPPEPLTPEPQPVRPAPEPAPRVATPRGEPMDAEQFRVLLNRVNRIVSSVSRLSTLQDAVSDGKWFTCSQIAQMMRVPVSSELKIQMAVTMYARVVDPDNTSTVLAALYHESDRQKLRTLLHRSQ